MADDFSVVAIIAAYNEADIIGSVVRDLIDQGISVYFIDDGSTDATMQAVGPYVGRGVIGIERLNDPLSAPSGHYNWQEILRRKAQLASELDADWFIHHDADEFRESPWSDVPFKEAIQRVDALGYNAIDFASFDFPPTDDGYRAGGDVRAVFPFYSDAASYDRIQIRCWKKTPDVDLASTGGHEARFENRRVFPIRFVSRHYPIRGQAHGERKVFVERRPRFVDDERARGWHVQYDDLVEGMTFARDPGSLTRFDPVGVRIGLSLRHRDVEALEQSLDANRAALDAAHAAIDRVNEELAIEKGQTAALRHNLEQRDAEISDARAQLHDLRGRLAARTDALEQRTVEVANLQAAVADARRQLDAFRRSLSWRWTAPARAVYRALTGR